jgi:hypothetical protein
MKVDITRNTFDPFQHFARVLMQQGRVQLDADWNEQAAIMLNYLRTLALDLIGPQGGPTANWGFSITSVAKDFHIGLGRYYVDGILCEADSKPVAFTVQTTTPPIVIQVDQWTLDGVAFQDIQWVEVFDDVQLPLTPPTFDPTVVQIANPDAAKLTLTLQNPPDKIVKATAPKVRRVITYSKQPDYPVPDAAKLSAGDYLIYLDVWERLITYIEDAAIREVALGQPDTATRTKTVWQVKAVAGNAPADHACDNFSPTDSGFFKMLFGSNRGRMKAMAKQTSTSADPCIIPPSASYQGPENQLYRVEIHRSGAVWDQTDSGKNNAATFKWSREDGSVVFPIVSLASGSGNTRVTLEDLGRDDRFGLAESEWVEIQDDTYVLQNRAETMLQVHSIDRSSMMVTLNGVAAAGQDATKHPLLRRWDYQEGDPADGGLQLGSDGAALVEESKWLSLEDGVQIQFQPPDSVKTPNQYRTGDYWLIPARTATGDVEWPTEIEQDSQGNTVTVRIAKPPDGIEHHYASLAVISVAADGTVTTVADCRKQFGPLSK